MKKRVLSFLLGLSMILSYCSGVNLQAVFAQEAQGIPGNTNLLWEYNIISAEDSTVELTAYKGDDSDIYAPGIITVNGKDYTVTRLGNEVFKNNTTVNSVTLADSITVIGDSAFEGATNLVCIVTTENLTTIGNNAFKNCTAFNSIILYDSVVNIGENAFSGCTNPVTIYCNENSKAHLYALENNIAYVLLSEDAEPEYVTIDDITYYIGNGEATVTSSEMKNNEKLIIPAYVRGYPVTKIGYAAFSGQHLVDIYFPNTVEYIGINAFSNNTFGNVVKWPESLKIIDKKAFYEFGRARKYFGYDISSLYLPEGLETIEEKAFQCTEFIDVYMPKSLKRVGLQAFDTCTIDNLYIPDLFSWYNIDFVNNMNYDVNILKARIATYMYVDGELITKFVIPEGTVRFGRPFTCTNTNIEEITLPSTLKRIIDCSGIANLKRINISSYEAYCSLACYRDEPFPFSAGLYLNGKLLTDIEIPSTVTDIRDYLFQNDYIKSVKIPSSVKNVSNNVFYHCSNLESVELSEGLESLYTDFKDCNKLKALLLPKSLKKITARKGITYLVYKGSEMEKYFSNNSYNYITIDENTDTRLVNENGICYMVFDGKAIALSCDSTISGDITIDYVEKNIPVVELAGHLFENCKSITSVTLGDSVKTVGDYVFSGCSGLTSFNYGDNLETFGYWVFTGCSKLTSLRLGKGIKNVGHLDFNGDVYVDSLETWLNYPKSPTYGCSCRLFVAGKLLTEVEIPENFVLKDYAFSGISSIEKLILNKNVTISEEAFYQFGIDKPIKVIYYKGDLTSWLTEGVVNFKGRVGTDIDFYLNNVKQTDIVVPDSITTIPDYAFADMNIKSVKINKNCKSIGSYAFRCTEITSAVIPDSVENIGKGAFYACKNLKQVTLSNNTKIIPQYCFQETSLEEVFIPEGVTSIGIYAFADCKNLRKIHLPSTLTTIKNSGLFVTSIYLDDYCVYIDSLETWFNLNLDEYSFSKHIRLFLNGKECKNIVVPDSISVIKPYTLGIACDSVYVPSSVKEINPNAAGYSAINELIIDADITSLSLDAGTFQKIKLPEGLTKIGNIYRCGTQMDIPESVEKIGKISFVSSKQVNLLFPDNPNLEIGSINGNVFMYVYENSVAHKYAVENNIPYFIIRKTINPEISYGEGITGTVKYTDGTPAANATVDLLYYDGEIKETVTTDANGNYAFTYAEVGRYTIRATDENNNIGSETVGVKRKNVFDVFVSGSTDIRLKKAYSVSGTLNENASVTITDTQGNIIKTLETENKAFSFSDITAGEYIVNASNENGTVSKEVVVFNRNVDMGELKIMPSSATVEGIVQIENRDLTKTAKPWSQVTVYNEEGTVVASGKTGTNGEYSFKGLPVGEYSVVAVSSEIRTDEKYGYRKNVELTGSVYVNITENATYTVDAIVLKEGKESSISFEGKVTAQGESQPCDVYLSDIFKNEIAHITTPPNGKYQFNNIEDGVYFVLAVTKSDGMGYTVVNIKNGELNGNPDIFVYKSDKIVDHENILSNIPFSAESGNLEAYRQSIIEEKNFYDGLSKKEQKEFSKDYLDKLNLLIETLSDFCVDCESEISVENAAMLVSAEELENNKTVSVRVDLQEAEKCVLDENGITTDEKYIQQLIEDIAEGKELGKYYNISLYKSVDGVEKQITDIARDTDTAAKIRITIPIAECDRGHGNYSFVHIHNGEAMTLADIDDNPDTITVEVNRFSTFALMYSDSPVSENKLTISQAEGKILVENSGADLGKGTIYVGFYNNGKLVNLKEKTNEEPMLFDGIYNSVKAFWWDPETLQPYCKAEEITK